MQTICISIVVTLCVTAAHAEGNCDFARQDNVEQCGTSLACLNSAFHNIEAQVKAKLGE
jgi:hypothetical protein